MREIIAAAALLFAVPAQAQYTVTISGTGAHDASQDVGDVTDILSLYGSSITYSAVFTLDSGLSFVDGSELAIQYFGHTDSIAVNGNAITLYGASPQSNLYLSPPSRPPLVTISISNLTDPGSTDDGLVYSVFNFSPAAISAGGIIPSLSDSDKLLPFFFTAFGSADGAARYMFTLDSFQVTGTQPTITPYVDPNDPDPGAVPEPAAWAMLLGGFGLAGGVMRRRRVRVAYA